MAVRRSTVCLLSPAAFAATTDSALDQLFAPDVSWSAAEIDPLGGFTVRLFGADRLRPGGGAILQARAVVLAAGACLKVRRRMPMRL